MASPNADLKTRIATLRHEILSYTPGKAVPCDDGRVVFPDKLVIGMMDTYLYLTEIVPFLRRALHGDGKLSKHADKRQTSTEDQEEYLTDYISVIMEIFKYGSFERDVQDLAGKVGCMVLVVDPSHIEYYSALIKTITMITGRVPLYAIFSLGDIPKARNELKHFGITDIYEIPHADDIRSDEDQLQLLDLLRGCLSKGDRTLATNELKKLCTNPRCRLLFEKTKKEAKEANHKMLTEVEELKKEREEDIAKSEKGKRSLAADMTKILESKQQRVDTLTETVGEKERNETTLRQQVEELKKRREEDRARAEQDNRSLAADMRKKLESKQQHVDTLTEIVREKERNEMTLIQQVDELKKGREEDRLKAEKDRGRSEKDKRSLAADMTKKLDSKQQRVDTLIETVGEKERNETTLRQQVEELKKEHGYKEHLLEQLERETWKLRTKIQLESEIRSREQKKKAETHQWSFIPWVTSGKQAQGGPSSPDDNSTGGLGTSDSIQAGEEPPDDEFAGILQQIADDLYDEAKIDSLGGQLGILQGDIQRALMTNMRFNNVTSDGTRRMLKQWRRGVSRKDERIELTKALHAAKLVNLADLYLSKGVVEEQIDAEYDKEGVNDQQLSTRDEASLEEEETKEQTDTQVLQEATASNDHTPRDGHTGDMASKTQDGLTDRSRSQHPDKSPESSTKNLDASEMTSEDVSSEEIHAGDDITNVSSIQPADQSSIHEMQVLPEDLSEIAPLVSSGGKPDEESTILEEEDLISQLVLIDPFPEKIMLLFLLKIIMDVPQRVLSL